MDANEDNLNAIMEFGHVIRVADDGTVTDDDRIPANEVVYLILDDDGQSLDDEFEDVYPGWAPLTGYTGQHGCRGPVMHPSEYIGGRMARDILSTPGYYVAVIVDGIYANGRDDDDENRNIGWAVFRHELKG